jgi:hypothetical protein
LKSLPLDNDDVELCPDDPNPQRLLLLDAGNACSPEVWHCEATEGRSMLMVMDAMGYEAVNVEGYLSETGRARLPDLTNLGLIDREHPLWISADHIGVIHSGPPPLTYIAPRLLIRLETSPGFPATLAMLQQGQIGLMRFGGDIPPEQRLQIFDLPPGTLPDPTIAATVDFVLSEARQYQRKRGNL